MKAYSLLFTIAARIFGKKLWLIVYASAYWRALKNKWEYYFRTSELDWFPPNAGAKNPQVSATLHEVRATFLMGCFTFARTCDEIRQSKSNPNTFFLCNNRNRIKSNLPLSTPLRELFTNAWMLRKKTSWWWLEPGMHRPFQLILCTECHSTENYFEWFGQIRIAQCHVLYIRYEMHLTCRPLCSTCSFVVPKDWAWPCLASELPATTSVLVTKCASTLCLVSG